MKKLLNIIANIYALIALAGLVILVGFMALEIFLRYFMSSSTVWLHEFLSFVIIWVTFLGFGKIVVDREDIMITFIVDKFDGKFRSFFSFFNTILMLVTGVIMLYYSIILSIQGLNRTTLLMNAPYTLFYVPLAMLMILVIFTSIYHLILLLKGEVDIFAAEGGTDK